MRYSAAVVVSFLMLGSFEARAADRVKCDEAGLTKLEAQIGAMSGKEKKRATRLLAAARAASKAGITKKCDRIIARMSKSSPGTASSKDVEKSIGEANADFVKAFNGKNAAALAARYAEGAAAFPPDQSRVDGRENIQKMWQAVIDAGATNLALNTSDVEVSGSLAVESGTVSLTLTGKDGKPMAISGKYVVAWKKASDGTWQLYRDIWNSNAAAPQSGQ
jgi:ketosteroid isomerase-like protein